MLLHPDRFVIWMIFGFARLSSKSGSRRALASVSRGLSGAVFGALASAEWHGPHREERDETTGSFK